jgi:hypothetical protein
MNIYKNNPAPHVFMLPLNRFDGAIAIDRNHSPDHLGKPIAASGAYSIQNEKPKHMIKHMEKEIYYIYIYRERERERERERKREREKIAIKVRILLDFTLTCCQPWDVRIIFVVGQDSLLNKSLSPAPVPASLLGTCALSGFRCFHLGVCCLFPPPLRTLTQEIFPLTKSPPPWQIQSWNRRRCDCAPGPRSADISFQPQQHGLSNSRPLIPPCQLHRGAALPRTQGGPGTGSPGNESENITNSWAVSMSLGLFGHHLLPPVPFPSTNAGNGKRSRFQTQ